MSFKVVASPVKCCLSQTLSLRVKCDLGFRKDYVMSMMFFSFDDTEERVLAWRTEPRCAPKNIPVKCQSRFESLEGTPCHGGGNVRRNC